MARRRKRTRKQEHAALLRSHRKDYDPLMELQGHVCGICERERREGERRFALDHDHKTMELRGALCPACNMRLTTRCTVAWMTAAIKYLLAPPARRLNS